MFFIFFLSCKAANKEYKPLFKCSRTLHEAYGVCTHINRIGSLFEYTSRDSDLVLIKSTGATWVRTDFDWSYCQPNLSGAFHFVHHDSMMTSVDIRELNMLGILGHTVTSKNSAEFEEYVRRCVSHYKDQVKYWEAVNEPDLIPNRQKGYTPINYLGEIKIIYNIVKNISRNSKVLFGGVANAQSPFVKQMIESGAANYCDIMNLHWYANKEIEPEEIIAYFEGFHELMVNNGINKQLWLTETGSSSYEGWVTEETQSMRLPRLFLISFAMGVDKVFYYKSRSNEVVANGSEGCFGLWHKNYTPKPAYYACLALTEMCPNKSTRPKLERNGKVYISSWKKPNGKRVWALWTSKAEELIELDIKGKYGIYDLKGNEIHKDGCVFKITPSITYIVGAKNVNIVN